MVAEVGRRVSLGRRRTSALAQDRPTTARGFRDSRAFSQRSETRTSIHIGRRCHSLHAHKCMTEVAACSIGSIVERTALCISRRSHAHMHEHSFLSPACALDARAHCGGGRSCDRTACGVKTRTNTHAPRITPCHPVGPLSDGYTPGTATTTALQNAVCAYPVSYTHLTLPTNREV